MNNINKKEYKAQKLQKIKGIINHRLLALAGIIGPLIFISILLMLDIVQYITNPILQTISDLVHGQYGRLQTISFVVIGIMLLIFAIRLYAISRKRISSVTGTSFFSITSVGFLLIAAFPSQVGDIGLTIMGIIHNSIAGVISASFIIGCIAFAHHFRKDPRWKHFWLFTVLTVLLCLSFACSWALTEETVKALSERLLLVSGFIWMLVISFKLLRSHKKPQGVPIPIDKG